MPTAGQGNQITSSSQLGTDVVTGEKILDLTVNTADIAANAVTDAKIAAHTTTKITSPFSLVTGTVPIAQGGTGQITKAAAFDALSPANIQGDVSYFNGTNNVRLAPGTSGQFLKTLGAGANPAWANATATYKNGITSRGGADASGTQNIAHGLGSTPSKVKITAMKKVDNATAAESVGVYNGTTISCIFASFVGAATATNQSSTRIVFIDDTGGADQEASVTLDATNIVLTWTKVGAPSATTIQILWEVE